MQTINRPTQDNPVINTEVTGYKTVWEYKTITLHISKLLDGTAETKMNDLGQAGYECFQALASGDFHTMYFKRARNYSVM